MFGMNHDFLPVDQRDEPPCSHRLSCSKREVNRIKAVVPLATGRRAVVGGDDAQAFEGGHEQAPGSLAAVVGVRDERSVDDACGKHGAADQGAGMLAVFLLVDLPAGNCAAAASCAAPLLCVGRNISARVALGFAPCCR